MLAQNRMLRTHALGSFRALLRTVASDPAMQLFLSLAESDKDAPNENFARELMELFTLGAGYTETDIREAARALTGFQASWDELRLPRHQLSSRAPRHRRQADLRPPRALRRRRRARPGLRAPPPRAVPRRASSGTSSSPAARRRDRGAPGARLPALGGRIKPVVAEILDHSALYADLDAPDMVKSPIVFRRRHAAQRGGRGHDRRLRLDAQRDGPDAVPARRRSPAGTGGRRGCRPTRCASRFSAVNRLLDAEDGPLAVRDGVGDRSLTPDEQVDRALAAAGPAVALGRAQRRSSCRWRRASTRPRQALADRDQPERADMLQRALRHLLLSGPDAQLH